MEDVKSKTENNGEATVKQPQPQQRKRRKPRRFTWRGVPFNPSHASAAAGMNPMYLNTMRKTFEAAYEYLETLSDDPVQAIDTYHSQFQKMACTLSEIYHNLKRYKMVNDFGNFCVKHGLYKHATTLRLLFIRKDAKCKSGENAVDSFKDLVKNVKIVALYNLYRNDGKPYLDPVKIDYITKSQIDFINSVVIPQKQNR